MRALARSVIFSAQFLELSDETTVDSDDAVRALESIADELSRSTADEREALGAALEELIDETALLPVTEEQRIRLQFYTEFMELFGLGEPTEDDET